VKIISKYVLKEHVGPLLFAFTALTSLLLLNYIARQLGQLVGKGLGWQVIGEFLLLSIPFTFAMTVPMSVLVSTLYAFSRLASENEITAFKASGISMWRLLTPVLVLGGLFSIGMLLFNDQVLPRANHRLAQLQYDIVRTKPTFAIREQVINEIQRERLYLRASRVFEGTSKLVDVTVYDLGDPLRRRTIFADSGTIALAPNERDLYMTLYDGVMQEVPTNDPAQLTRLFYRVDRIRVPDVASSFQQSAGTQTKSDREMSICEMTQHAELAERRQRMAQNQHAQAAAALASFEKKPIPDVRIVPLQSGLSLGGMYCAVLGALTGVKPLAPPATDSALAAAHARQAAQLDSLIAGKTTNPTSDRETLVSARNDAEFQMQANRNDANRYLVEIHKKFSLAVACVVFVLVGAPTALRFPRGGVGLTLGVSFAIFGLYYVGLISGESLADRNIMSPALAMWATNILILAIGLTLALRMGRESGSSRGGGGLREAIERFVYRQRTRRSPA